LCDQRTCKLTAVLLMLLVTGKCFVSLHYEYLLGATSVREIEMSETGQYVI
jgi:hypothetical protein